MFQPSFLEPYEFKLCKAKPNSAYETEKQYCATFKGKFANALDKRSYRILKGVNGKKDGTMIMSTRLPENIEPNDKIIFGDHVWLVESVGVYLQNTNLLNAKDYSEKSIIERSPKGISVV